MELGKLRGLKRDKRGDVTDPIVFLIIVGVLGIALLVLVFAGKTVTSALSDTQLRNSSVGDTVFEAMDKMNSRTIQVSYGAFMIFFIIGIIYSAFLAGEHPVFIFIFFMFTLVGILLAVMFANIYGALLDSPTFAQVIADQIIFDFVFRNMPKIFVVVSALGMLIMLSRIFGAPQGRSNPI